MSQYKHAEIGDDVYFWFAANSTSGSGDDGASPLYDVRLAGAASDAAAKASGSPTLLSHGDYGAGLHEIAIDTDGWDAGEYAVFCTITVSAVNPAGFCGSFLLRTAGAGALDVNTTHVSGTAQTGNDNGADINSILTAVGTTLDTLIKAIPTNTEFAALLGAIDTAANTGAVAADVTLMGYIKQLINVLMGGPGIAAWPAGVAPGNGVSIAEGLRKLYEDRTLAAADYTIVGDLGTVQSADNNTILAHADYGLAKLVRSTTPANKLDISATGEAGLDFDNIKNASGAHTLTNITVPIVTTNTDMRGTDGANTVEPDPVGTAATPAEVATALENIHLDHLLATTYDPASKPGVADALLNEIIESDSGVSRFTENSLEQAPSGTGASAATIADAVWDEDQVDHTGAGTFGVVASEIASILDDTNELQTDDLPTLIAALPTAVEIQAEMEENGASILDTLRDDLADGGRLDLLIDAIKERTDNLPDDPADDSDIDAQLAAIVGYIDTEIGTIITAVGTTLVNHLLDIKGTGFAKDTHSLPQCLTATGFSTHDAAAVKTAIEAAGSHLALIKAISEALPDSGALTSLATATALAALNNLSVADITGTEVDNDGTAISLSGAFKLLLAALTGKSSGGGTSTPAFRDIADTKNRISATVDENGNRTAIGTRDAT